jgi:hypothetical protein
MDRGMDHVMLPIILVPTSILCSAIDRFRKRTGRQATGIIIKVSLRTAPHGV